VTYLQTQNTMEEKEINLNESMHIISSMINRAQNNVSDNGFLFIFWGWLVFITAAVFYVLFKMDSPYSGLVWFTMPAGGIFTGIYAARQSKKEKVKTYIDDYLKYLWISFGVSLLITLCMFGKLQLNTYPIVIMLYAIATCVSGGMLRFTPLIVGGFLSFPICLTAFFVSFDNQVLLLCLSLLVSYIVPGHLLKAKFNSHGIKRA
jgi:hypothetical protein